ncbi:CHRD domain-containing protein [Anaeromyxobacter oryzae]|uniref:CHRD domain-containing protein n=1 Tax=Anaeromyxobacter oryzae TaxID=2918170 RepID=A0ABN6MV15_9BACT|nr:CHRD domain-containing protein [Anaeromyxobacter oryzae]BDG03644.1 hypothetical protein AMOR_26400 [Anaeromyxobacter oryzae]
MKRLIRGRIAVASSLVVLACGSSKSSTNPNPAQTTTLQTWVVQESAPTLTTEQRAAFLAGELYVNAHTAAHGSGEIRGQLDRAGTIRLATLDGAQETPAVTTSAFGAGVLSVDDAGQVRGFLITSGLVSPTAAHVHLAARGTPGGIIIPLSGGPELWVVPDDAAALTADQRAAFAAGDLYFNAHTAAHPNGEIRGQLDRSGTVRLATLEGSEETPAVTTSAFGGSIFAVDDSTGQVSGFALTSGLVSATAAHLHQAARGTPGAIVLPLSGGPDLWVVADGAAALPADVRAAFAAGDLYVNAHTAAHPNGEIRGQLDRTGAARLASLDGAQETPPVTTTAFGGAAIAVDDGSGEVTGFLVTSGLASPTAAHVHGIGARGAPAGVLVPLSGP